jgi:hypothetical protein
MRIKTDFGIINVDADTISYYNVSVDTNAKTYEITFYFTESSSSLSTKLSSVEETVKLMKSIDYERTSLKILKK